MRNFEPIYGVDYLPHHYFILKVPMDATQDQIRAAFKREIKLWHEDRVAGAAEQIQRQAAEQTMILLLSYGVLSDEKARAEYDKQLAEFDPDYISYDGKPKLNKERKRIDLDFLVSGEEEDTFEILEAGALKESGYDESTFGVIEQAYKATDSPTPQITETYKGWLGKKLKYLGLLELAIWHVAGITNADQAYLYFFPNEYVVRQEAQVEEARVDIAVGIEGKVLALTAGAAPKLLNPGGVEVTTEQVQGNELALKQELTDAALSNFDTRITRLTEISQQRAEVMEELVKLVEWEYYPAEQELYNQLLIAIVEDGRVINQWLYKLDNPPNVDLEKVDEFSGTVDDLKSGAMREHVDRVVGSGTNVIILYADPNLPSTVQMGPVAQQHSDKLSEKS